MQTTKNPRRTGPPSQNYRRVSDSAAIAGGNSSALSTSSSSSSLSSGMGGPGAAAAAQGQASSSTGDVVRQPLVLTPVSQLPKGIRRNSRPEMPMSADNPLGWDPEQYNPDGSLRTMHRMPGFDQSYAQAMKARYVRHRDLPDREKELSVNEIFDQKKS